MKEYPSILGPAAAPVLPCIAFYKYDGSNLRFSYNAKQGWCKFGTRRRLFSRSDPEYGQAIDLFLNKYASGIDQVLRTVLRGTRELVCFCEYYGPCSFGGQHDPKHPALAIAGVKHNEPMDVVLFDVNVYKKGLLAPQAFLDTFGHLPVPPVIYRGDLTPEFVADVRAGKYPVWEGVVCKGCVGKAPHGIWFRKIKTQAYLDELKRRFAADWEKYAE